MSRVLFKLSMPNVGSWNGQWSGAGKNYAIVRNVTNKALLALLPKTWHYSWGDGWGACVSARILAIGERSPKSDGFCGYEWMVENIVRWLAPECQHEWRPDPYSGKHGWEGQWERCLYCRSSRKIKQLEAAACAKAEQERGSL